MTAQWQKVVDHVQSFREGTYEGYTSSGGYDNNTQFGRQFGENYVSWCVIFDWCVYDDLGLAGIVPKVDNVTNFSNWAKARGQWSSYPSVGAWINFDNGAHTELVVGFDATYVYSKGGNTNTNGSAQGDGIYSHKNLRTAAKVTGYFAPKFSDGVCPPTADPKDYRGGKAVTSWRWTAAPAPVLPGVSYLQVRWAAGVATSDEKRVTAGPLNPQDDVKRVQDALAAKGFLKSGYEVGFFDDPTLAAYKAFQVSLYGAGPSADGLPGVDSLTRLGAGRFVVQSTTGAYTPAYVSTPTPAPGTPAARPWVWSIVGTDVNQSRGCPGSVRQVQDALKREFPQAVWAEEYGVFWGWRTTVGYRWWQERLYPTAPAADKDGIPGPDSLAKLGVKQGFDVHQVPATAASADGTLRYAQVTYKRGDNNFTVEDVVKAACKALGFTYSTAWVAGYRWAMGHESGGNTNACNCNDSNNITPPGFNKVADWGDGYFSNGVRALNGALTNFQCSRGPWQCIPQTFAAYHAPGTSVNIYDPVASCAASMNYVHNRYGVAKDGSNLGAKVQQFRVGASPLGY